MMPAHFLTTRLGFHMFLICKTAHDASYYSVVESSFHVFAEGGVLSPCPPGWYGQHFDKMLLRLAGRIRKGSRIFDIELQIRVYKNQELCKSLLELLYT